MEGFQVEIFVAVHLSNCEEEPVIGVIKEVTEEQFTIHYWKGSPRKMVSSEQAKVPGTLDASTTERVYNHAFL